VTATNQSAPGTAAGTSTSGPKPSKKAAIIDLTMDTSDGDDDDDDAVISAPSPGVINLDTPSPAPHAVPDSPNVILSNASSPAGASHSSNPAGAQNSPKSESPRPTASETPTTRASTQSPSSALQNQALNLEAMSDADFDEFLKGLSWGV